MSPATILRSRVYSILKPASVTTNMCIVGSRRDVGQNSCAHVTRRSRSQTIAVICNRKGLNLNLNATTEDIFWIFCSNSSRISSIKSLYCALKSADEICIGRTIENLHTGLSFPLMKDRMSQNRVEKRLSLKPLSFATNVFGLQIDVGPKQHRPRGPHNRFANWRCCRNRKVI